MAGNIRNTAILGSAVVLGGLLALGLVWSGS